MPATPSAVSVEHASRHYLMGSSSVRAVDDVSLTVGGGEFLALLGSSGSGKSTLLNLIGRSPEVEGRMAGFSGKS